jgi:hypothetical protein
MEVEEKKIGRGMGTFYGLNSPPAPQERKELSSMASQNSRTKSRANSYVQEEYEGKERVLPTYPQESLVLLGPKTSKPHENSYSSSKFRGETAS